MDISPFFVRRPIVAWVCAILVMLAGALAFWRLPVAQFPEIALPQAIVTASWPGASAQTMEDTVTQVIEQQIRGIDGLLYMESTSDATGTASLALPSRTARTWASPRCGSRTRSSWRRPCCPSRCKGSGCA